MSKKPDFNLLVPVEYEQDGQRRTKWVQFGSLWENRDGGSYSGKVDFWPVGAGNRLSIMLPKEKSATENGSDGK